MNDLNKKKYCLLFKTGDAELRALEHTSDRENIFPIIELTRGRKSKTDKEGITDKRLSKVKSLFKDQTICLDLTTSNELSNSFIIDLFKPDFGYRNWTNYLLQIKKDGSFKKIVPTLILDVEDPKFKENLKQQCSFLLNEFESIAYRNNINDDGCYDDIEIISNYFTSSDKELIFIVDNDYVAPATYISYADKTLTRIKKIKEKIPNTRFIIISTSFPKVVSDLVKDDTGTFQIIERKIYTYVEEKIIGTEVFYGDYGSVNPIRNDQVSFSKGWIPRIDVPNKDIIYFYKHRIGSGSYSDAYIEAAKMAVRDPRFPRDRNCWGLEQIDLCSKSYVPSSAPAFWISVRMNTFMCQRIKQSINN